MNIPYTPPALNKTAFNCPHCNAFANQHWSPAYFNWDVIREIKHIKHCFCSHCSNYSFWYENKMIYPATGGAPLPNTDMPDGVRAYYDEARSILNYSPRAAAALLRLCVQKLCEHLGGSGENISINMNNLIKQGLPARMQQSLQVVHVIGPDAVHPGQIDPKDSIDTATKLFILINLIVDVMISQPMEIDKLFKSTATR